MSEHTQAAGQPGPPSWDSPQWTPAPGAHGARAQAPGGAGGWPQHAQTTAAKGFLAALFDFGFTSFVTPKVIRVLYILVVVLAGIWALGSVLFSFAAYPALGVVSLIVSPLVFLIITAFYRVCLEFFAVIFQLGTDMRAVRDQGMRH